MPTQAEHAMHADTHPNRPWRLRPVFVCGSPRSGTTLMGAMLGAHSEALTTPEAPFVAEIWQRLADGAVIDLPTAHESLVRHWRFRLWGVAPPPPPRLEERHAGAGRYAELVRRLVRSYGEAISGDGGAWWIDHTPANAGAAADLAHIFPDARFVHVLRDGRAVAASVMKLDWGPSDVASAARWWRERVGRAFAAQHYLGERMITIRYEDLVHHPRETLERLCGFLGMPLESEMLAARGFRTPAYTARQHELIGRPPDRSRIASWRSTLSERQIEIFESLAGPMLVFGGYPLLHGPRARRPSRWERWGMRARSLVRERVNRRRRNRRRAAHLRQARAFGGNEDGGR